MTKNFRQWSVKYRPKTFDTVLGNERAVSRCRKIVENRDAHAILFHGRSGCAKTTLSRLVAEALASGETDIEETNVSDNRGIEDVRGMIRRSAYLPKGSGDKVFILDECHELLGQAQSAILKEIEEPKHDRVVWILTTDRPHRLSEPLRNRLYKIQVEPPPEMDLARFLYRVIHKEGVLENFSAKQHKRIAQEVARSADCVPREALQILKGVCDEQGEYADFKELVVQGIRNRVDGTVDRTVLQVVMALYSTQRKLAERADYLVNQLAEKDLWAVVTRLGFIHHDLLNSVFGVVSPGARFYRKELEPSGAIPTRAAAVYTAQVLLRLRNDLSATATPLPQLVVPVLLQLIHDLEQFREA